MNSFPYTGRCTLLLRPPSKKQFFVVVKYSVESAGDFCKVAMTVVIGSKKSRRNFDPRLGQVEPVSAKSEPVLAK